MTSIEIIDPINGKGRGRELSARAEVMDEENYIELAAIVRNDAGEVVRDAVVVITATDASQNKTLNGTGDVKKIFVDGQKAVVPIYSYRYEIKKNGKHDITFTTNGVSEVVKTPSAKKDNRPQKTREDRDKEKPQ